MRKYFNTRIFKEPYPGIFLGLLAVLVNVALWSSFYSDSYGADGSKYNEIALSIYHGEFDFGYIITPVFPALIALIYLIGGVSIGSIYIANIVFFAVTVVLLYYGSRLITNNTVVSFLPAFLLIFYYPLLKMNFNVLMETPTVFLLTLSLFFIIKYHLAKKPSYLYFSIVAFSVLVMLNNRFIVLLGVYFLFLSYQVLREKRYYQEKLIIPILIVFVVIGPWFIYQGVKHKQLVVFTPTWHNLLAEKFTFFKTIELPAGEEHISFSVRPEPFPYKFYVDDIISSSSGKEKQRRLELFTEDNYNAMIAGIDTTQRMVWQRLKYYFTLYHNDFRFMYNNDFRMVNPSSPIQKYVQLFILLPIMILAFVGIALSIYRKHPVMILFGIFLFAHVFLHIITHFNPRYRLTAIPIIVILAAYALGEIDAYGKEWRDRKRQDKVSISA